MVIHDKPGYLHDEMPDYIKVDFDSDLETLLNVLTGCSCLLTGLLFLELLSGGTSKGFWPSVWIFLKMAALTGIFGFIRMNTDNYYVLSPKERAIFYRFKLFGYENLKKLYSFEDIRFATTCGRNSKGDWSYVVGLVDVKGVLTDFGKSEKNFTAVNAAAINIAGAIGCDYLEAAPERVLLIEKTPEGKARAENVRYEEKNRIGSETSTSSGSPITTFFKIGCGCWGLIMLLGFTFELLGF